ncbi:MAG: imidazole glycerol phosphate synthase, glutamine amidotransferase subunit [Clostridiales bacterium]|jgi:glutamine amidotransferase|nr:imidazole glycerol phosphate synthase, glutamine amidotransferase subunit [Clostridiales bacterium]
MIAVLDYGAGNLKSVEKALEHLGYDVIITSDPDEIMNSNALILPGVGAFGNAMKCLEDSNLIPIIKQKISEGTPFLGICLGMQMLFDESEETPGVNGLSILEGNIIRIPDKEGLKIPHMGWNSIQVKDGSKLFEGIDNESYVYFVHSYYLVAKNSEIVAATTNYSEDLQIAVEYKNIFATQFHPEKSGDIGLKILDNFAKMSVRG